MNEMDKKEEKKIIRQEFLTGERALFMGKNLDIYDTIFDDGESPLKESRGINLYGSMFKWKYPLWYSKNIVAEVATGLRWREPESGTLIISR